MNNPVRRVHNCLVLREWLRGKRQQQSSESLRRMAVNGPDSDQMYPDQVWCVCEQLQVSEITNLAIICG